MMRWVKVNNAHFNLDLIKAFYWRNGKLFVYWAGEDAEATADVYDDKDRSNYERMCCHIGAAPIGVKVDGEK